MEDKIYETLFTIIFDSNNLTKIFENLVISLFDINANIGIQCTDIIQAQNPQNIPHCV